MLRTISKDNPIVATLRQCLRKKLLIFLLELQSLEYERNIHIKWVHNINSGSQECHRIILCVYLFSILDPNINSIKQLRMLQDYFVCLSFFSIQILDQFQKLQRIQIKRKQMHKYRSLILWSPNCLTWSMEECKLKSREDMHPSLKGASKQFTRPSKTPLYIYFN